MAVKQRTCLSNFIIRRFTSSVKRSDYLIETNEVAELIAQDDANLRIINATFWPPGSPTDGELQHEEHRLTETTQYFSIADVVDPNSKLPNTMPDEETFIEHMEEMRVPKDAKIICYDE